MPDIRLMLTLDDPSVAGEATAFADPRGVRIAAREGTLTGPTAGLCASYTQANLVIVPAAAAGDFRTYCERNPKPCPLLAMSEPGVPHLPAMGADLDVRTDLPRYKVYRDGAAVAEPADITDLWRDDLVAFALGCSFSFEDALMAEGLPVRHVAAGRNVAMYATAIETAPAGPFHGKLVVSLRAMPPAAAIRAIILSARQPMAHGAPVHFGDPAAIGIADLAQPEFGDAPVIEPGDVPVFWACGVTPQLALVNARLPLAITHAPGHMLVTDVRAETLATHCEPAASTQGDLP